ncbi:MAG TPA: hypothetical protein DCR40_05285 [Prolixibacteraceae bacterium]|nr:hypothetical protein [Prolixibacteraceae bacterium]
MKPLILFFIVLGILSCNQPKKPTDADAAKFIFRATVERIRAATLPEISDVSNCIVVKVKEVIYAPPDFGDWTGKSITVSVKEIGRQKPDLEQVFYTNGWLYGKSLAVVERASRDSRKITNKQVLDGITAYQDQKVRDRLKSSELVVSGKIIKVSEEDKQKTDSEHDPYWMTAVIEVDSFEKGKSEDHTVIFRFALSYDVMWEGSPKFKVGDIGIWLFRRNPDKEKYFTITESEDFFPIERLSYIRSLLK